MLKNLLRLVAWLRGYRRCTTQVNACRRLVKVPFSRLILDFGNDKFEMIPDDVPTEDEVVLMLEDFDLEDGPDYEYYNMPPQEESNKWWSTDKQPYSLRRINEYVKNNEPDFVIEKLK